MSKTSFDHVMLKRASTNTGLPVTNPFSALDERGVGRIAGQELKSVLTCMGDKIPEIVYDKFFKNIGMDGEGEIDIAELYARAKKVLLS